MKARNWLAGDKLTYADLAAAAHLSSVDYLGDVPWSEDETAKNWYARVKSRPSFRPLLAETVAGLPAATSSADLDFNTEVWKVALHAKAQAEGSDSSVSPPGDRRRATI